MDEPALDALEGSPAVQTGIVVCPFLVSAAGPWRSAEPSRDHRCSRMTHGARIDPDHQRRYCLGSGGPGCPHHVTARAPGRLVSMLPVVIERGPLGATLEPEGLRRLAAPATVVVVGAALGAFFLARGPGAPGSAPGNGAAGSTVAPTLPVPATASPSVTAAPSEATTPTPTPAPTPTRTPSPTPGASPSPAAVTSPVPARGRTYRIRPGDTLGAIAKRFGTTTRALAQLNGITDFSLIRAGDVLKLP